MDKLKILKIAQTQSISNDISNLSYLLGQRNLIARDMIGHKADLMKDPVSYEVIMMDALNYINNQIKELLILE